MKKPVLAIAALALVAAVSSCTKGDDNNTPAATTCTIIINDTLTVKPDSVVWDMYNGTLPRIQAFTNTVATFTLWPTTFNSGTSALPRQQVYWYYKESVYTPATTPGSLVLSKDNDLISGSFSATGTRWSGAGATEGKVTATFTNARQRK